MSGPLSGKKVAVLATDGVETIELEQPRDALEGAGATVTLVSLEAGEFQGMEHDLDKKRTFTADVAVGDTSADEFDGLLLPGGVANPDSLRADETAVAFVRAFADAGKPIAAICHAPWTLIEAGVADGRTMTSYPSLQTDLRNAGATWIDEETVLDRGVLTSRNPGDLDAFCASTIQLMVEAG